MDSGTIRVRFKTSASRDVVHKGVSLVNGYHGPVDYNQNRSSRLWLNIHGLAPWSPSAPMIFLMLYDKTGQRIHVTANATLRDETWYELTAIWDTKQKSAQLYLDGLPLKLSEEVFPDAWAGADPIETIDAGDSGCSLGSGVVQAVAVPVAKDE
jgi:hypothetical protein